jgi:hypothetical protein
MHSLYSSTSFCIPTEKKLFGRSRSQVCTASFTSSSEVNLRPCNASFSPTHKLSVHQWCSVHTEPTYNDEFPLVSLLRKETALCHILRWCNLAKERPCFRPRCCHSIEGRALYCKWRNPSTGTVNTAQCASSSLSRLPRNLEIFFTFFNHLRIFSCLYVSNYLLYIPYWLQYCHVFIFTSCMIIYIYTVKCIWRMSIWKTHITFPEQYTVNKDKEIVV